MEINKAARIRAVGESAGRSTKRGLKVCTVNCQGCGKKIPSDGILDDVEYVKTKRGTELFFHTGCMKKVWRQGIV